MIKFTDLEIGTEYSTMATGNVFADFKRASGWGGIKGYADNGATLTIYHDGQVSFFSYSRV